jgi:hypothetical protein
LFNDSIKNDNTKSRRKSSNRIGEIYSFYRFSIRFNNRFCSKFIFNNTKNKTLLEIIEYYYYSKRLSESKEEKKNDSKGIKLIKEFIKNMYYVYGKEYNKKDD